MKEISRKQLDTAIGNMGSASTSSYAKRHQVSFRGYVPVTKEELDPNSLEYQETGNENDIACDPGRFIPMIDPSGRVSFGNCITANIKRSGDKYYVVNSSNGAQILGSSVKQYGAVDLGTMKGISFDSLSLPPEPTTKVDCGEVVIDRSRKHITTEALRFDPKVPVYKSERVLFPKFANNFTSETKIVLNNELTNSKTAIRIGGGLNIIPPSTNYPIFDAIAGDAKFNLVQRGHMSVTVGNNTTELIFDPTGPQGTFKTFNGFISALQDIAGLNVAMCDNRYTIFPKDVTQDFSVRGDAIGRSLMERFGLTYDLPGQDSSLNYANTVSQVGQIFNKNPDFVVEKLENGGSKISLSDATGSFSVDPSTTSGAIKLSRSAAVKVTGATGALYDPNGDRNKVIIDLPSHGLELNSSVMVIIRGWTAVDGCNVSPRPVSATAVDKNHIVLQLDPGLRFPVAPPGGIWATNTDFTIEMATNFSPPAPSALPDDAWVLNAAAANSFTYTQVNKNVVLVINGASGNLTQRVAQNDVVFVNVPNADFAGANPATGLLRTGLYSVIAVDAGGAAITLRLTDETALPDANVQYVGGGRVSPTISLYEARSVADYTAVNFADGQFTKAALGGIVVAANDGTLVVGGALAKYQATRGANFVISTTAPVFAGGAHVAQPSDEYVTFSTPDAKNYFIGDTVCFSGLPAAGISVGGRTILGGTRTYRIVDTGDGYFSVKADVVNNGLAPSAMNVSSDFCVKDISRISRSIGADSLKTRYGPGYDVMDSNKNISGGNLPEESITSFKTNIHTQDGDIPMTIGIVCIGPRRAVVEFSMEEGVCPNTPRIYGNVIGMCPITFGNNGEVVEVGGNSEITIASSSSSCSNIKFDLEHIQLINGGKGGGTLSANGHSAAAIVGVGAGSEGSSIVLYGSNGEVVQTFYVPQVTALNPAKLEMTSDGYYIQTPDCGISAVFDENTPYYGKFGYKRDGFQNVIEATEYSADARMNLTVKQKQFSVIEHLLGLAR